MKRDRTKPKFNFTKGSFNEPIEHKLTYDDTKKYAITYFRVSTDKQKEEGN
jgi:hypothetical protein